MLGSWAIAALFAAAGVNAATQGVEQPIKSPILGTDTVHGCYNSTGELELSFTDDFNAQSLCAPACRKANKSVGASYSKMCYCGDKYPPKQNLVDDSKCTELCPGFGEHACGGLDTFTVYNTGYVVNVADSDASSSKSSAAATASTTATSAPVSSGTSSSSATSTPQSSGGSNTVGIAVGVVVGIVALAGIGGAVFFVLRRRRNSEIEEEHRRNAAVNAFISGGKPPSTSGSLSISDSRLDPSMMAQRRISSGSIDDNQDYSRRILRVTNA